MPSTKLIEKLIDQAIEDRQEDGRRKHLGASVIGRPCSRQIWYMFHWARTKKHSARILRIFDRGHREEHRFVKWLRDAGIIVWEVDPETKQQFRMSDHGGHFGGSCDGVARGLPDVPLLPCLLEFKTTNSKGFKELEKTGVEKAKKEHFVQMQIYMEKMDLPVALYMAINKDTDAIYYEHVLRDTATAHQYLERAKGIIFSDAPPFRISDEPSFYLCKMCDYSGLCHGVEMPDKNCRTCGFSEPIRSGGWACHEGQQADPKRGCDRWLPNPNMINKCTHEALETEQGRILRLKFDNGARVTWKLDR